MVFSPNSEEINHLSVTGGIWLSHLSSKACLRLQQAEQVIKLLTSLKPPAFTKSSEKPVSMDMDASSSHASLVLQGVCSTVQAAVPFAKLIWTLACSFSWLMVNGMKIQILAYGIHCLKQHCYWKWLGQTKHQE